MLRYNEYRPTQFDTAGAFLGDRGNWLVVPVIQTRDSGPLELSNFTAALKMLGGEGDNVEVHRFGHWGPGWFEIIIVRPETAEAETAADIERSLEDYPLLDDSDFSEREFQDYQDSWNDWGWKDFIRHLRTEYELSTATCNFLEDCSTGDLQDLFESGIHSGEYYIGESSGVSINFRRFDMSRQDLAAWIKNQRQAIVR